MGHSWATFAVVVSKTAMIEIDALLGVWTYPGDELSEEQVEFELSRTGDQIQYKFSFSVDHNHGYLHLDFSGDAYALKKDALVLYPSFTHKRGWEDYFKETVDEQWTDAAFRLKIETSGSDVILKYDSSFTLVRDE